MSERDTFFDFSLFPFLSPTLSHSLSLPLTLTQQRNCNKMN